MPRAKKSLPDLSFARWRHIELIVWAFSMMMAWHWIHWNFSGVNPTVLIIGLSLIPLYAFRNKYPYPRILLFLAPVGYLLFALGSIVFLRDFASHWISWVIAFFACVSIVENVAIDVHFAYRKFAKR